jgi:hypothetical protein
MPESQSEKCVTLPQKMQVGPCIHMGVGEYSYKRLKLAQLLGQLGVFPTEGSIRAAVEL